MQTDASQISEVDSKTDSIENDVENLASGASITLIAKVGGRGFDAITDVILARFLGPSLFGSYSIGITLLRIIGTIGMLGFQNGVIRFGSKYKRSSPSDLKSTLFYGIGIPIVSGMLLGIILYIFSPWIANNIYHKPELVIVFRGFAFGFPLAIGLWVTSAATRVSRNMKYSAISEDLAQPVSNLIILLLMSIFGFSLIGAILSNVISLAIGFGFAIFFVLFLFSSVFTYPRGENISIKELLMFSLPTGFAGTFTLLTDWTGRLMVGIFRPTSEAGIYQTASQISIIFVIILNAMNTIFSPIIADLFYRDETLRMEELYRISTKWGLYIIAPLYLVIMIFPQEFITAIFGNSYVTGYLPMLILVTTQVINVGTGAVGYLLIMTGRQNNWFITSGLTMTLCIALNAVLVPIYGMLGAAIATSIAITSLYVAGLIQVRVILQLWPYDRRFIKGLISFGFATIVLIMINLSLTFPPLMLILISVFASYLTFFIILFLLGLNDEDREFVNLMSSRLRRLFGVSQ